MINEEVKEISDFLISKSAEESDFHPIDRFFLEPFIDQILKLNRNEFLLYNFQHANILYSSYLFLCLPELWEDIMLDDLINIIKQFKNDYSYFCFIYFTYKFIEIDSIKLILELPFINVESKNEIKSYVKNQYSNFLKSETDYFFFDVGVIGVKNEVWIDIKQRLLINSSIESSVETLEELEIYVMAI